MHPLLPKVVAAAASHVPAVPVKAALAIAAVATTIAATILAATTTAAITATQPAATIRPASPWWSNSLSASLKYV
jgi:hypothetical protein